MEFYTDENNRRIVKEKNKELIIDIAPDLEQEINAPTLRALILSIYSHLHEQDDYVIHSERMNATILAKKENETKEKIEIKVYNVLRGNIFINTGLFTEIYQKESKN